MPYIGRELDRGNYLKLDDISSSFDSSTTTFNLTNGGKAFYPGSAFSILVVLAGVVQEPETAYQINQAQITFASAPLAGDQFFCIVLGQALGVNTPANGSVNGTQLAKPFNYDNYFYLDDANNRVGIATATPQKPLHVVGEGQFDSVRVLGDLTVDGTTTTLDTVVTEVDKLEVLANNSTVAVAVTQSGSGDAAIFMGGNFGIGTNNPAYALDVKQTDTTNPLTIAAKGGTDGGGYFWESNSGTTYGAVGYGKLITANSGSANSAITTWGSQDLLLGTNRVERLRIHSSGKFSFGTGTASAAKYTFNSAGTNEVARFESTDTGAYLAIKDNSSTSINFVEGGGDALSLGVNSVEKLRITSDGKVRVPDNGKFVAGADDDLQIKHTGNDAYLDNYTGHLYIRQETNGEDVYIQCDNGSGGLANYVKCDGSTGAVELGHYGNTKLETTSSGVNVTGNTETDDLTVTGTAYLNGTVSVASSTGTNGQVLSSTGVGVTWTTLPTARTTSTQTAIEDQTTFNFTYNVGFLDVFYNGVKLAPTEFTASNGSQVVLNDVAYAGDLVEFVSYGTVSTGGGGGGASSLNELSDVTITGTPVVGETLTHNGTKFVNDYTATTTTTATTQTSILSLDLSVYRSVEYQIQVTEGSKYHTTKILAIHNGTAASHNEYGTLNIGASTATFDVDISGSNLRLLATPASSNSTVFKVKFTAIKV